PLTDLIADAGVTDSKEEVIKYYKNATEDRVDEAVLGAFIDNGNDFLNWTIDTFGWKWTPSTVFGGDYYEPLPGWVPFGRSGFGASDSSGPLSAAQMWAQVSDRLTEGGVEILLGAEATSLITN
ncbi:MAG: hypothetical protein RR547_11855, partial [Raoultibacter sp.]